MDIFFLFSAIYLLFIFTMTILVFLWILGADKTRRDARNSPHNPSPFHPQQPLNSPSPSNIQPRRLSFSAAVTPAVTPNHPNPPPHNPRRVTFNLTPEQQQAQVAKTPRRITPPPRKDVLASIRYFPNGPTTQLYLPSGRPPSRPSRRPPVRPDANPFIPTVRHTRPKPPYHTPTFRHLLAIADEEHREARRCSNLSEVQFCRLARELAPTDLTFGFAPPSAAYPYGLIEGMEGRFGADPLKREKKRTFRD